MTIILSPSATASTGMTFLQLVQRVVEKGGISGSGPETVISQSGELKRAVNYVNEAWNDIQLARTDWRWMRGSVSFETVADQPTYTAEQCGITDLEYWLLNTKQNTFRSYVTAEGVGSEIFFSYQPYDAWRDCYQYGAIRDSRSRPLTITVTPDQSLGLGETPDSGDYTIVGEYMKMPSLLVEDGDIPGLPIPFHMLIVYRALMIYAQYEENDYLRATAERDYNRMYTRLVSNQLPEMTVGGALA